MQSMPAGCESRKRIDVVRFVPLGEDEPLISSMDSSLQRTAAVSSFENAKCEIKTPLVQETAKRKPAPPIANNSCKASEETSADRTQAILAATWAWIVHPASIASEVLPWTPLLLILAVFVYFYSSLDHTQQIDLVHAAKPEHGVLQSLEPTQSLEAWESVPLPMIALLIVAGYGLAILAMLYLPPMLGPEASIWALLTALVFLLTWKWWSYLLLEVVFVAECLPLNCLAVFTVACFYLPSTHFFREWKMQEHKSFHVPKQQQAPFARLLCKTPVPSILTASDQFGSGSRSGQDSPVESNGTCSAKEPSNSASEPGLPVYVHVYDITHEDRIERLNSVLAPRLCPWKLGGLFHVGVEVNGKEWSFGYCSLPGTGVCGLPPRTHPSHHFRETICLARTQHSEETIVGILKAMSSEYQGSEYTLLQRNCLHFADDLCQRLGVGGVPAWVQRLARCAEWFSRLSFANNANL